MKMGIGRFVHIIFLPICEFGRVNLMCLIISCLLSIVMIALVSFQEPVCLATHFRINITYYYKFIPPIFIFYFINIYAVFVRFLNIWHHFFSQFASPSAPFFPLFFFLDVRLGLLVSKGDRGAKLIFFSDSVLTLNEGTFTKSLPTLICLCLITTLA